MGRFSFSYRRGRTRLAAMSTDSIAGTIIAGKYQLVRLLGQGGMGAVYEGRNTSTLKRCAVKLLLSADFGGNVELVKRFFREAKASSIIESDHIVQVFDSGYDTELGWPYMVMEMLQGEDLEKLLLRVGSLQPLAAAKVVLQASMGLAKAHDAGIVHRDIKPANLYLSARETGDMVVKLLDFGIAKVRMENMQETSTGLTRTGSMLGTPLYMSPEQVAGASSIDASSDVWSLGIVLFELLSGQIPWSNASSLGTLMAAIIHENLPLLQDRAPWVPPELAEVCHRAISRDTKHRYKNAGELRDALAQLVTDGPRITADLLEPLPQEYRGYVAPRLALSDDGMLRATTRSGLTANASTLVGPQKSSKAGAALAAAAVALAVLGGGGFVGYRMLGNSTPSEAPTASAPALASAEPGAATKHFELPVLPDGAEASIDGKSATITAGKLPIDGPVGATRNVRLSFKDQQEDFVVAIAESGVVPPKLELAVKAAPLASTPPAPGAVAGRPAAAKSAAPAAKPTAAVAAKPAEAAPARRETGLNRNVDEFGK